MIMRSSHIVDVSFFQRPVLEVAPELLGKNLVRKLPDGSIHRSIITETEAYDGPLDLACHGCKGRTKRNEVMFCEGGVWYVYFIYGMYWMLNAVTGEDDYPSAVLIRGTLDSKGPGRLTRHFQIDRSLNGMLIDPSSELWIEEGETVSSKKIRRTPRIGIDYAGPWAKKLYRFVLDS
jgi:DNA-3-methyladenine glycosylase